MAEEGANQPSKLIQIGPKGGAKKDGFNLSLRKSSRSIRR